MKSSRRPGFVMYEFAPSWYAFVMSRSSRDELIIMTGITAHSGWSRIQLRTSKPLRRGILMSRISSRGKAYWLRSLYSPSPFK